MFRASSSSFFLLLLGLTACHIPGPLPFSTGPELPNCGDGILDSNEICDDGTRNNDQWGDCTELCTLPYCGDGLVHEPTEQCDLGTDNAEQSPCLPDCTLPATCGDGIEHPLEGCDLGSENSDVLYGTPGCSMLCKPIPFCGDGNLDEAFESCDDGNDNDNDACTNACLPNVCGDGLVYLGVEACDDANESNEDACTNSCDAAICGDGFVHAGVEECDANDDCGPNCYVDRYMFVTAEDFRGNFELGLGDTGIERADWLCRTRAEVAKLHLGSDFKAWLSDDTSSPATRFTPSKGRYILPDGTVFAQSWDDLVLGNIEVPPNMTENLTEPLQGSAWSNTNSDGTRVSDTEHCNRWSTKDWQTFGREGATTFDDSRWSDHEFSNPVSCAVDMHLYCFEQ